MNKFSYTFCFSILCLFNSSLSANTNKSALHYFATAEYFADDNVTKAQNKNDIREDTGFIFVGSIAYKKPLSQRSSFLAKSKIALQEYSSFDGLSNTKTSASASYIFSRGRGLDTTSYRLFAEIASTDSETNIRDSTGFKLGGELKRRLTDKLRLNSGLILSSDKSTEDSDVYDNDQTRLFVNFDLAHSNKTAFYSTLNYIDGSITSTAQANSVQALPFINYADAIEFDDAFGGQASGQAAYRLDNAKTYLLNLGSNIGLNSKSSVDLSLDLIKSKASGGIYYNRQILRAVYLRRF